MVVKHLNIAIVVSQFNQAITDKLLEGALMRLNESGFQDSQIKVVKVPGAVEIPFAAKLLGLSKKYDAIICLGAVIQGETDHYDYVCQQVSYGCQKVMLELNLPVIFGVLTTQTVEQAEDRVGGKEGHKGIESVDAAIQMMEVAQSLTS